MEYKFSKRGKDESGSKKVTLPVSDTVPASGNYTVTVLNMEGEGSPVVDSTELIENTGAGTADDVSSDLQAPEPGRERNETS